MPIRQLGPNGAAKRPAVERAGRPASDVKGLVESALDAGARHIRVEVANGGLGLIRVSDDGCGIPSEELPLAFARHATSKVQALGDFERLATLGFRGEALASIAAVAGVTLLSRPRAATLGGKMAVVEGEAVSLAPACAPAGTTVTVRDLFASVPGRLKFLKTRGTETGRCVQLVEQYALAFPEVRFTVVSEGRQVFTTPGDGKLASVLVAVYGLAVAEHMVPLDGTDDTAAAQPEPEHAPAAVASASATRPQVSGYVSRPSCYKSTRGYLSFFVNRRWVQSRTLNFAVEEAYHSLLLTGRHPIAVINVALDPAQLDANVHPAKTEVRFLYERQVFAAVQRAVRAAVLATAEAPEVSSRAFAIPDWSSPAVPASGDGGDAPRASAGDASLWGRTPPGTEGQPGEAAGADVPAAGSDAGGFAVPGAADAPVGGRKLPVMRVLGQGSQSYIITEGPDGGYMVDQHAAHERVLLERMIAEWRSRAVSSQLLLQPVPVELAPAERETIEEHLDALAQIGFAIEPFGGDALLVRALPAVLAAQTRPQPLRELLLELAGGGAGAPRHWETSGGEALADTAGQDARQNWPKPSPPG